MFKAFKRAKDKLFREVREENIREQDNLENSDPNTEVERKLGALIGADINNAEISKKDVTDDTGLSVEEQWDDEYKLLKGGGLQWSTNIAYRSKADRKARPNSEDNFLHPAIQIQTANITASPVEATMSGKKKHEKHAKAVTHMSRFNDKRNKFNSVWKVLVHDFIAYGPVFMKIIWDPEWMGGVGPDRFVGETKLEYVSKEKCLFDPAVINLERDLNKGKFVGFPTRQSVKYVQDRWERFAKHISTQINPDEDIDEGVENDMTTVYEMYYRGFPEYMPEERVAELRQRAAAQEEQGDTYKAKDLYDMAKGLVEGVHLAFYCNDILLEYIPYVYDHGQYPGKFVTRYDDPKCQWGYGEIRNTKIPQILHNKADEIEIEAMVKEGLGGGYFQAGAISDRQLQSILEDGSRGGMWFGVNNVNQIRERTGVQVPASIPAYKEHKQRMVETVSSNTAISQGVAPKGNLPFKAIAELGARTDVRTKQAADKLKEFLIEVNKLRIELFAQFYTEERYYRYIGSNNEVVEGAFKNDEIFDVWARETNTEPILDAMGQPIINPDGTPATRVAVRQEFFVPEFDIDVNIISKKPDDRDYYTQLAMDLWAKKLLVTEDLYYTLDEGKLPATEDILDHIKGQDVVLKMIGEIQQLPPEVQQQAMQMMEQGLQQLVQKMQGAGPQQQQLLLQG